MTTPNDPRALMLAHVLDLLAIAARNGGNMREIADTLQHAELIGILIDPTYHYRSALNLISVAPEDIDASVAACMRGEHPADSLMGRVAKMRDDAERTAGMDSMFGDHSTAGARDAYNKVLDTLEGEGRSAKTAGGGT